MTNYVSLKSKKAQKTEPTLLEELSGPLRDVVIELKSNLAGELQKVRESGYSGEYLKIAAKLLPLILAFNTGGSDFSSADSMQEIGVELLKQVGFHEPDEDSIQQAITAQDDFIEKLREIYARAAPEEQPH